jgi:RNA polymerase sigma-70 factor (ECF subfamily)
MAARTDEKLLSRASGGDDAALTELLNRSGAAIRRKLQGKIARRWQSLVSEDDVLQETYAEAFLDIAKFNPQEDGSFVAWLGRIARNNLTDAVKALAAEKRGGKVRRIALRSEEDSLDGLFDLLSGSTTSPSMQARRSELREKLQAAIGQLPTAYRQVVECYDVQGQSVEDVAAQLGCSPGAVFMRRARAHRVLRELLGTFSNLL